MEEQKVTIICGIKDRIHNLVKVIDTWLIQPRVSQVIIVDWNSKCPVLEELSYLTKQPKLKVVRVVNVEKWMLSQALNLAASYVKTPLLLKLDVDNRLGRDFFNDHPLKSTDSKFYSGNWSIASDMNERHLNGILYIATHNFNIINGYNEHFGSVYGYDDTDLYERLKDSGMEKADIKNMDVTHIPHSNCDRSAYMDLELKIIENYYVCHMEKYMWSPKKVQTQYLHLASFKDLTVEPIDLERNQVLPEDRLRCNTAAIRNILNKNGFPFECTSRKSREVLMRLYDRRTKTKFIIEPINGLGNRLRALASAAVISEVNDRNLLVVWKPDEHLGSKFEELFLDNEIFVVSSYSTTAVPIKDFKPQSYSIDLLYEEFKGKDDVYAISATVLDNSPGQYKKECEWLQKYISPIPIVQKEIDYYTKMFNIRDCIGIQIRMGQDSTKYKFEDVSFYGDVQKRAVVANRNNSHYKYFMFEMEKIWYRNPKQVFFLCADSEEVYDAFQEKYPDKMGSHIVNVKKTVYDRSHEQLVGAIIDVYLLARCSRIFISPWSSFGELAGRLGQKRILVSGKDFGTNRFALLFYPTSYNIGDTIQSLAASQFLPTVDYLVDRDNQKMFYNFDGKSIATNVKPDCKIIQNGWFDGRFTKFPPNENLKSLFVSFHLNETEDLLENKDYQVTLPSLDMKNRMLLDPEVISYFILNSPIGTRDEHTMLKFLDYGVNAYLSCCMTLTLNAVKLGLIESKEKRNVYVVDCHITESKLYEKLVPPAIRGKAIKLTHGLTRLLDYTEKENLALNYLQKYVNAKFVITSRLHVALPCLALGTPCYFIHDKLSSDPRFDSTIQSLIGNGIDPPDENWNWTEPTISDERLDLAKNLRTKLEKTVANFIMN